MKPEKRTPSPPRSGASWQTASCRCAWLYGGAVRAGPAGQRGVYRFSIKKRKRLIIHRLARSMWR